MTPLARVVYSPITHSVAALALITALVVALLRPQPAIVVVMPASAPAAVTPFAVATPVAVPVYASCGWYWHAWPSPCWRD